MKLPSARPTDASPVFRAWGYTRAGYSAPDIPGGGQIEASAQSSHQSSPLPPLPSGHLHLRPSGSESSTDSSTPGPA